MARGPAHPNTLDASVLAHTSPVYVDVAVLDAAHSFYRRVAETADR